MKKPLIVFGAGDIAALAHFYFTNDSNYEIKAFTVDQQFMTADSFCDVPVVPVEDITKKFPPSQYNAFVALSYSKLNAIRKEKYLLLKTLGYSMVSYISTKATVLTKDIGENCFILEDNTIQPFVKIGQNVTLWSGNHIGHHSTIHDHCFISSHVVVSGGVEIEDSCFIGVNATLRDHIKIGRQTVIGAGALILQSTDPESLYIGPNTPKKEWASTQLKKI